MRTDCDPIVDADHFGCFISPCCPIQLNVPQVYSVEDFSIFTRDCSCKVKRFISEKSHLRRLKLTCNFGEEATFETNPGTGRLGNVFHISNKGRFEFGLKSNWIHNFDATYYTASVSNLGPVFADNIASVNGRLFWSFVYFKNITTEAIANGHADRTFYMLKKFLV